jgi:O-antigen/teichoic acid export membrane protein
MGVSLYTSRVVLNTLGVEDFGIFGVVGGIVAMFGFLNASMSGATSRFLTFELETGNKENLKKTFSSALTIHILIAILILILAETVGLWFLESKLVIPENRMYAARWVYQLSIASTMITILQVPYNSVIIAHERMNIYAYVEILNVCLRLAVIYFLLIGNYDKLILYAILVLCVSVITVCIFRIYCLKYFEECRYKFEWDKKIIYPILSFSGWDLYGNMSAIARTQGVNMLLNIFFGTVLNAANSIAIQVQGAVMLFANNIIVAIRPQIVKSYASKNYQYTVKLVLNASKYTYILLLILSLPLMLEMNYILNLWLKNVPIYAVSFCRFILMFNFFATMSTILVSAIHATGNVKRPSLINGSLYLLVIPISYISFKLNGIPEIPYICNILFVFIGMISNVYTLKLYIPQFPIKEFVFKVLCICLLISFISFMTSYFVMSNMQENFFRFIIVALISTILTSILSYYIATDRQIKKLIKQKILFYSKKWTS